MICFRHKLKKFHLVDIANSALYSLALARLISSNPNSPPSLLLPQSSQGVHASHASALRLRVSPPPLPAALVDGIRSLLCRARPQRALAALAIGGETADAHYRDIGHRLC
jgi:hypothetical protein